MPFAAMLATLFASPLARDAEYTPPGVGQTAVAVRVVRRTERPEVTLGDTGAVTASIVADVRVADLASPAEGATLSIDQDQDGTFEEDFTVRAWRPDEERLVWLLDLDPA